MGKEEEDDPCLRPDTRPSARSPERRGPDTPPALGAPWHHGQKAESGWAKFTATAGFGRG